MDYLVSLGFKKQTEGIDMNKHDFHIAKQRQINLTKKLAEAEKLVNALEKERSKEEAEAVTRAILSIKDENTIIEILKLIDNYVISPKDRRVLSLKKR